MSRRRERLERPIKVLTDDLNALTSVRYLAYLLAPRVVPIVVLFAVAVLVPNPYVQRIITIAGLYGLLALSWDFLAGTTGLVSLGQALFFGVGAYSAALWNRLGADPLVGLILATLVGATLSTLLLLPCLSLRGIYFSMTTLVYPLLFARIIEATAVFGGTDGLLGIEPLPHPWIERLLILVVVVTAVFALRRMLVTDVGLVLRAVGDDDLAVRASGIAVTRYRVVAVFVAAALGAFAGAYFTHLYMVAGLSAFALDLSILPIAAAVVGGVGTLAGPVLGAFLLLPLSEAARDLGSLRIVVYSGLLVLMILWKPDGLVPYLRRRYEQVERWVDV